MKPNRILLFFAVTALLTGCFKDVSFKTNYVLKPLLQELSGDPKLPFEGAQAFAYGVDTTLWTVASYEDALAGIITHKTDPAQKMSTPVAVAQPLAQEGTLGWLSMPLNELSQMVVVVAPEQRLYAYTQQKLAENLPNLYVSLLFQPWKEGKVYAEGKWSFFNEFYTPPVILKCFISPTMQGEEGGASDQPITKVKAYAFAADTTAWRIASYQDALTGKITSKTDPTQTRTNPTFPAYPEPESQLLGMSVSSTPLMIVVVDQTNSLYAYSKQEVELAGEPVTFPIIFRPWQQRWIHVEEGWRVVNEQFGPQTPVQKENNRR